MKKTDKIPKHVAIIMDGNGRWAKLRGEDRSYGHIKGVESVKKAVKSAIANKVSYLTLYAFSTENWGRPKEEVDALMELLCKSIIAEKQELKAQGVKLITIGNTDQMSEKVREHLDFIYKETAAGDKLTLVLALNYSAKDEIVRAVKQIASKVENRELAVDDISSEIVDQNLMTASIPDPDLLIRTSGECRLSNFLLWQVAYSEFIFTEVMWPDFDEEQFSLAIQEYSNRNRRFGLVTE